MNLRSTTILIVFIFIAGCSKTQVKKQTLIIIDENKQVESSKDNITGYQDSPLFNIKKDKTSDFKTSKLDEKKSKIDNIDLSESDN